MSELTTYFVCPFGFLEPIQTVNPLCTIRRASALPKSPLPIIEIIIGSLDFILPCVVVVVKTQIT